MRKKDYDSRLLSYRSRKVALTILMTVMWCIFASSIGQNTAKNQTWLALILPIIGLGALLIPFPATEEWQYQPWQNKPRKVETLETRK